MTDPDEAAARAVVALAEARGVALAPHLRDSIFFNESNGRFVHLWVAGGAIGYSLQGRVSRLPSAFVASASAFTGLWNEAGTFPDAERALAFVQAWLLGAAEVDDLPPRDQRKCGIG